VIVSTALRLGAGEREALSLAQELHADLVLLDDLGARVEAERCGVGGITTMSGERRDRTGANLPVGGCDRFSGPTTCQLAVAFAPTLANSRDRLGYTVAAPDTGNGSRFERPRLDPAGGAAVSGAAVAATIGAVSRGRA
jgi:hypothetical protein